MFFLNKQEKENKRYEKLMKYYNLLEKEKESLIIDNGVILNNFKDVCIERDNFKAIIEKYEDIKFVAIEDKIIEKQKEELETKKNELLKETQKFDTENKLFITKKSTIYLRKNEQDYLKTIIDNMNFMKIPYECIYDLFVFSDLEAVKEFYREKGRRFYWRMDKKEDGKKFNVFHFYLK